MYKPNARPFGHAPIRHNGAARVGEILSKLAIIDKSLSKINEIDAKLSTVHIMETDIINLKKTSGNMANTTGTLRKHLKRSKVKYGNLKKHNKQWKIP